MDYKYTEKESNMDIKYVIAVKHLFNHKGDILNRWEYARIDSPSGGHMFWNESINGVTYFCTVDELRKWFYKGGRKLLFYAKTEEEKDEYDLGSLCINSVIFRDPLVYLESYLH